MTTALPQTSTGTKDLVATDALGPAGEYRTRNRVVITDTAGVPVAELSIVIEGRTAIEMLARRFPHLARAGTPTRIASPVLRGLRSLPVVAKHLATTKGSR